MTTRGYKFSNHVIIPDWKLIFKVAQYALIFIISVISSSIEYWPERHAKGSVELQVLEETVPARLQSTTTGLFILSYTRLYKLACRFSVICSVGKCYKGL